MPPFRRFVSLIRAPLIAAATLTLIAAQPVHAQPDGNLFGNLFKPPGSVQQPSNSLADAQAELVVRMDQLENQIRQLTGQIEQLQYRNQQLEQQVQALGEGGARTASATAQPAGLQRVVPPPIPSAAAAAAGRRSDAFDPAEAPGAPGAPQQLGSPASGSDALARAPVDLAAPGAISAASATRGGGQVATLSSPGNAREMFDLGAGYMQRQDYASADPALRQFLQAYPNDRLVPEATYLLGESLFQRQYYKDAAENFLQVSTKYPNAPRAAESLLRLGQSLASLNEHEAACATLAEVERKYPRAASSIRLAVEREQKRAGC